MLHDLLVAVRVEFDVESVGHGGAGFAWPHCSALGEQPLHMPMIPTGLNTSDTDEESVPDRDHEYAEPIDHEVSRRNEVYYILISCMLAMITLGLGSFMPSMYIIQTVCFN